MGHADIKMGHADIKFPLKSETLLKNIDEWWQAFQDYEGELNACFTDGKDIQPSIVDFMAGLKSVNPDMYWEFSRGENKPHKFTIAPERNYQLEPVARLLKTRAPDLKYFDIEVDRDATPWEWITGEADSRFSWDSNDDIYFSHAVGPQNFIDLTFYIPASKADAKQEANSFLLAELALGEKTVADWIGYVDVEVLKAKGLFKKKAIEPPSSSYPIKDIRSRVAAEIARFKNTLPKTSYGARAENMTWSLVEISQDNPEVAYLSDMYIVRFCDDDLFSGLYSGRSRFNGQRFSALGETFIVLQINGASSNLDLKDVSSRGEIEDVLNGALQPQSLGGVIGGSMGHENAYIFMALENEAGALDVIIDTLRSLKLGEKTWIFFCDSRRQCEWVGLWDDTPAPELSDR